MKLLTTNTYNLLVIDDNGTIVANHDLVVKTETELRDILYPLLKLTNPLEVGYDVCVTILDQKSHYCIQD